VRGLGYGLTLADLTIVKDKDVLMELPEQARWLMADAEDSGYGINSAAIDAVGLGQGMVDDLNAEGFHPEEFKAGAAPDPNIRLSVHDTSNLNFDSLRSQLIYLYARGVELGIIKHFKGCPFLNELFKEAAAHQYEITDKVIKIESKEHIKKRLGFSPDLFDSVLMWLYMALRPVQSFEYDKKSDDEPEKPITSGLLGKTF